MTDLEKVKACAELMRLKLMRTEIGELATVGGKALYWQEDEADSAIGAWCVYDPRNDDAQAMALAKKLMMTVDYFSGMACIGYVSDPAEQFTSYDDENINAAIVECAAKLHASQRAGGEG